MAMLSNGGQRTDCPAIPVARVARVGASIVIATVLILVAALSWMLAPLLVLGAVPIIDTIDGQRLRGIHRAALDLSSLGKGFQLESLLLFLF